MQRDHEERRKTESNQEARRRAISWGKPFQELCLSGYSRSLHDRMAGHDNIMVGTLFGVICGGKKGGRSKGQKVVLFCWVRYVGSSARKKPGVGGCEKSMKLTGSLTGVCCVYCGTPHVLEGGAHLGSGRLHTLPPRKDEDSRAKDGNTFSAFHLRRTNQGRTRGSQSPILQQSCSTWYSSAQPVLCVTDAECRRWAAGFASW